MLKIYIDDPNNQELRRMINLSIHAAVTNTMLDADCVMFSGGADILPLLYGEKPLRGTDVNIERDRQNIALYRTASNLEKPMVGVCRGAQFLNVMSGGDLWQDVDNHCGSHKMFLTEKSSKSFDYKDDSFLVTSTHHQMMIPSRRASVLAYAHNSTQRKCWVGGYDTGSHGYVETNNDIGIEHHIDPEVVWYEHTKALCVQYHPEYPCKDESGLVYFWHLFNEYIVPNQRNFKKET